jgi:cytochrome c-type biogenesis protein CcmH
MIWVYVVLVAAVALAPFAWAVWRGGRLRGRRDAALALHRAQLAELDRDLAEGRIMEAEHVAARLEVQRRLLADAELTDTESGRSGPVAIILTAALVPAVAIFLYVRDGVPNYRQAEAAAQAEAAQQRSAQEVQRDEEIIARLKTVLATMDPAAERTRQGYVMLGNAEISVGNLSEAADAFRKALAARFDPNLGAETAEVITDSQGKVTPEAAALFRRALAEAPPNVPWRKAAEKRVSEAGGS